MQLAAEVAQTLRLIKFISIGFLKTDHVLSMFDPKKNCFDDLLT